MPVGGGRRNRLDSDGAPLFRFSCGIGRYARVTPLYLMPAMSDLVDGHHVEGEAAAERDSPSINTPGLRRSGLFETEHIASGAVGLAGDGARTFALLIAVRGRLHLTDLFV